MLIFMFGKWTFLGVSIALSPGLTVFSARAGWSGSQNLWTAHLEEKVSRVNGCCKCKQGPIQAPGSADRQTDRQADR